MANWTAKVAAAFHAIAGGLGRRKKVKSTSFDERNGKAPFNASGVAQVGPGRFVFIDNHDPSALFELALDADGTEVERISRRPMAGVAEGQLRDPEGLTRVGRNGEIVLIVASSLCVLDAKGSGRQQVSDGLVRVRYTPHGDLHAEAMQGFRDWLLRHVPSLAAAGQREPDAGGLNIEGLAWDPRTRTLLFGLRGPADPGSITVIRVPVDAGVAPWTTGALEAPSIVRAPRTTIKREAGHPRHLVRRTDRRLPCSARAVDEHGRRTVSALRVERQQRQRRAARCQVPSIDEARGRRRILKRRRKETPRRRRPRWLRSVRLPRERSVEVEVGTGEFLVDPFPAARREVGPDTLPSQWSAR